MLLLKETMVQNVELKKIFILLPIGCFICLAASVVMIVGGLLFVTITEKMGQPNGLRIEEVAITSNFDNASQSINEVLRFSRDSDRIYAIIRVDGPLGIPIAGTMWVKWYYEDEQIASHYLSIDPRLPIKIWIEPPEGEMFRPGRYQMEIFLERPLIRTVEFEVE